MKKILISAVAVLALVFTVFTAYAAVVEGRPGRIDMTTATIDEGTGLCVATYAVTVNGNTFISNAFSIPDTRIKVTENDNVVNAWCRFTDTSGVYEKNAEVGDILSCTVITAAGDLYTGGTGHVTAAANNIPRSGPDPGTGGNVTLNCQFDLP